MFSLQFCFAISNINHNVDTGKILCLIGKRQKEVDRFQSYQKNNLCAKTEAEWMEIDLYAFQHTLKHFWKSLIKNKTAKMTDLKFIFKRFDC